MSASPERFLHVGANEPRRDASDREALVPGARARTRRGARTGAGKERQDRAENLMIVDLMRNDLSRVCAPTRSRVSCLLEHYATVHHLVSTVVGVLAPGADAIDLLRASFPGGSITGAPKLRAMEVIAELEPSRRGVCGSIGYWSVTGEARHQHRHSHRGPSERTRLFQCRRWYRRRLGPRAGIPGDARQGPSHDRCAL